MTKSWWSRNFEKFLWPVVILILGSFFIPLILYESLWREFVQSGLMEEKERNAAFEEAAATGGTKIGGVNLVVLGARTLQKLVDLKFITLEQAQGILDQSRRR